MLKLILKYSLIIALLLLASKWLDYSLFARVLSFEAYVGILAVLFTSFGIWMGLKLTNPNSQNTTVPSHSSAREEFKLAEGSLEAYGISPREYEVLQKIAEGKSNQEIAESLFISLSTVKSHVSHLYEKLDVKRRTQAIQISQKRGLLP